MHTESCEAHHRPHVWLVGMLVGMPTKLLLPLAPLLQAAPLGELGSDGATPLRKVPPTGAQCRVPCAEGCEPHESVATVVADPLA